MNYENTVKTFSERLRALRAEAKLTQKQCAEQLGVETYNYNKWENEVSPPLGMICKIAEHFSVTTDYLLGLEDCRTHDGQAVFDKLGNRLGLSDEAIDALIENNSVLERYNNISESEKKKAEDAEYKRLGDIIEREISGAEDFDESEYDAVDLNKMETAITQNGAYVDLLNALLAAGRSDVAVEFRRIKKICEASNGETVDLEQYGINIHGDKNNVTNYALNLLDESAFYVYKCNKAFEKFLFDYCEENLFDPNK